MASSKRGVKRENVLRGEDEVVGDGGVVGTTKFVLEVATS